MARPLGKKITYDELLKDIEFYVNCPECDKELIVENVWSRIKCPACGWEFKPTQVLSRIKTQNNPSKRGFSMGVKYNG